MKVARCDEEQEYLTHEMLALIQHYTACSLALEKVYSNLHTNAAVCPAMFVRGCFYEQMAGYCADKYHRYVVASPDLHIPNFFTGKYEECAKNLPFYTESPVTLDEVDDELVWEGTEDDGSSDDLTHARSVKKFHMQPNFVLQPLPMTATLPAPKLKLQPSTTIE